MDSSVLQVGNNDALDWVNEEEDIQFEGGEKERDDSDPEEGGEDEDSEVEASVSARNASRGDARPAVPVDFRVSHPDILSSHMKGEFYSHPTFGIGVMCCFTAEKQ